MLEHCSSQTEIPSEFIEPYIRGFLMIRLEALYYGFDTPDEFRSQLKGVERFVNYCCGIHARIATGNIFDGITRVSDEKLMEIVKQTFANEA